MKIFLAIMVIITADGRQITHEYGIKSESVQQCQWYVTKTMVPMGATLVRPVRCVR